VPDEPDPRYRAYLDRPAEEIPAVDYPAFLEDQAARQHYWDHGDYARNRADSDVTIVRLREGLYCLSCGGGHSHQGPYDPYACLAHLHKHVEAGYKVPPRTFRILEAEMDAKLNEGLEDAITNA
jgi:hypothetical protein